MPTHQPQNTAPRHGELLDLRAYQAKKDEKSLATSVKNTFKRSLHHILHPFIKLIVKAETLEQFEEVLNKPSIESIINRNPAIIALIYVKTIQLLGMNRSLIILKGVPREAATQLKAQTDCICKTTGFNKENTREVLIRIADKIQTINPKVWSALIKYFDTSFNSKVGSVILSRLFNIRNLGTNQKLVEFIKDNIVRIDDIHL